MGRPRERLEPLRRDPATAANAFSERAGLQPAECRIDLGQVLDGPVAKGEVALLLKDLAGGGGLRPVGHLLGRLDGLPDLLPESIAFDPQLGAERLDIVVHRVTVRVGRAARTIALSCRGEPVTREAVLAIEIDRVCAMEVDTTTSELSLEYQGKTYWFCARGCLLEFRDDPETYLAPGGPASA